MKLENIRNNAIAVALIFLLPLAVEVGTKILVSMQHQYKINDLNYKSNKYEYLETNKHYSFWANLIFGMIFLFLGIFVIPISPLNMAFTLSGVLCLIRGYSHYWYHLSDIVKFGSLILAILILIITSVRLVNKRR